MSKKLVCLVMSAIMIMGLCSCTKNPVKTEAIDIINAFNSSTKFDSNEFEQRFGNDKFRRTNDSFVDRAGYDKDAVPDRKAVQYNFQGKDWNGLEGDGVTGVRTVCIENLTAEPVKSKLMGTLHDDTIMYMAVSVEDKNEAMNLYSDLVGLYIGKYPTLETSVGDNEWLGKVDGINVIYMTQQDGEYMIYLMDTVSPEIPYHPMDAYGWANMDTDIVDK